MLHLLASCWQCRLHFENDFRAKFTELEAFVSRSATEESRHLTSGRQALRRSK